MDAVAGTVAGNAGAALIQRVCSSELDARWNVQEDAFRHELLEYADGADGFVRRTLPFISLALAADEPVLVAVTGGKVASLKGAMNGEAHRAGSTWIAWTTR